MINLHRHLDSIHSNLKDYYVCNFELDRHIPNMSVSNNYFIVFSNSTYRFVLSKNTEDNQGIMALFGNNILIRSTGALILDKPDIINASGFHTRDMEFDVVFDDYSPEDCFFNLSIQFPEKPSLVLQALEYYYNNRIPDGVQIEIDLGYTSAIDHILSRNLQYVKLR